MSIDQTLTSLERLADLDLDQLRQLVGLVEYDADADAFPVSGWDAIVWSVGNATQAALLFQHVFGMELVAQFGPETGNRDHQAYVLRSGALSFVLKGGVDPASSLLDHHRRHGDGIVDIALDVPDVDRCIAHARGQGARVTVCAAAGATAARARAAHDPPPLPPRPAAAARDDAPLGAGRCLPGHGSLCVRSNPPSR